MTVLSEILLCKNSRLQMFNPVGVI